MKCLAITFCVLLKASIVRCLTKTSTGDIFIFQLILFSAQSTTIDSDGYSYDNYPSAQDSYYDDTTVILTSSTARASSSVSSTTAPATASTTTEILTTSTTVLMTPALTSSSTSIIPIKTSYRSTFSSQKLPLTTKKTNFVVSESPMQNFGNPTKRGSNSYQESQRRKMQQGKIKKLAERRSRRMNSRKKLQKNDKLAATKKTNIAKHFK